MKGLFIVLLIMFVATPTLCARVTPNAGSRVFNIFSYGAKGDGQTDDSQAFEKAWGDVCNATQGTTTLLIPKGKSFMLRPVSFEGPCKPAAINIQFEGTIIAPKSVEAWKWPENNNRESWLRFWRINGLVIKGGGTFDGQGSAWWNKHSDRPIALQFLNCENLALKTLNLVNSTRSHITIASCKDSIITDIYISAPDDSPNTDGINISGSSNILIQDSKIESGDDCIAINHGSTFINVTGVMCGPGHGISVGSLGKNGAYNTVEDIYVRNCTFQGTMNGARIKTWMGGSGYARKIRFEDIILIGVKNPVIIDQQYDALIYNGLSTAVKVSDVTYSNVRGTSASENAIILSCDASVGCTDIVLNNIDITLAAGGKTSALCSNAHGTASSFNPTVSCLS
ncbi:probable polygalacturonase At3g15720 [Lotus japonicus]|uniref:probable polygalacturonase At3g15720 n=1 Tax=Lotus japonicus TaxID=34305 RepID=UPI00258C80CF|nr:probable polygalacturonase At3g15720 [Lotus japonicus]